MTTMKRANLLQKTKIYIFVGLLKKFSPRLISQRILTIGLIVALLLTTLVLPEWFFPKSSAQFEGLCPDANGIIQVCNLQRTGATQLTEGAIDDVLAFYNLAPSERAAVMKYARNDVRAMFYRRFIEAIKKPNRTAEEDDFIGFFSFYVRSLRKKAALKAREQYYDWQQNACNGWQPVAPFTYSGGTGCNRLSSYFGGPTPPTFEEFQQFGAAFAYQGLNTPEATEISAQTVQTIGAGVGAGLAIVGGAVGAAFGATVTFGTLASVFPYASAIYAGGVYTGSSAAASAASGAVGAGAVGGAVAVVVVALTVLIIRTISVVQQSELPGKLDAAVTQADAVPDLRGLLTNDDNNRELYGAFILSTLPDFRDPSVTAPGPNDRQFLLRRDGADGTPGSQTVATPTITYLRWDALGNFSLPRNTVRLNGGWFVESQGTADRQVLTIQMIDNQGKRVSVSRQGGKFLVSEFQNPNNTKLVDELKYISVNAAGNAPEFQTAKLKFDQLNVKGLPNYLNCSIGGITPDPGTNVFIGSVAGSTDSPSSLTAQVNGGNEATINNITVRNLQITSDYRVKANVVYFDAATPTAANFTLTVRNTVGQEQTDSFAVKKTAVKDDFPATLPTDKNVGEDYAADIGPNPGFADCVSFNYSLTSGSLPLGTKIVSTSSGVKIQGTLLAGGTYNFTLTKSYANGEVLNKIYTIFVKSDIANLPANLQSWWRAEEDASDFTGRANGTTIGNAAFADGFVNRAFKFDGSNSYVRLPDDAFSPSLDFTFEAWFKTPTRGVILGRQRTANPYETPQYGATPAIYVDQNGRLRVQMFQDQNNQFITSGNRVDDDTFHHAAVIYRRQTNTRTAYLDGALIGTVTGGQDASPQKYQFGTGYVSDGTVGGINGWLNFTGLLDDATLYGRALSESEITEIVRAGAAGKMSVEVQTAPPAQRDGADGAIKIIARGGTPSLSYSINGGNTFKDTGAFLNLSPGTYAVVVADGSGRRVARTAVVTNPPPNLSSTTQTISPKCATTTDGQIKIFATGLTGAAQYSVRGGANSQSSNVFTDLGAGNYTPWVYDTNSNTVFTGDPVALAAPPPFSVSPANFPNAALGQPYSRTFNVTGGTPPFVITASGTNSASGNALPAGLNATADGSSVTISGAPQSVGTFPILLSIRDQNTCFESRTFPLTITSNQTYGITGKVTNGGQGLANVTVSFVDGNGASGATVTDASGNYSFNSLGGGANFTLTAQLNGYVFTPSNLVYNNLAANITNANFATSATTSEGDIAARPNGDGAVDVLDLVSLGRILNNLDSPPASGAEFQRADIAPRSTLGNGVIDANDLTQMRNYIVASNPKTPAGGAINAASLNAAKKSSKTATETEISLLKTRNFEAHSSAVDSATVSAAAVSGAGGSAFVPVTLNSNGNVSAVQFTVTFDPNKLTASSISGGANLPSGTTVATNASPGKISAVLYRPLDGNSVFPSGNVELLRLNFSVNQNAVGNAAIVFTDAPTARLAADAQANAITLNSTNGNVAISTAYSISGKITNGGQGLANVNVYRGFGAAQVSATTDAAGNYKFDDLVPNSNHTVTVLLNGYSFTPSSRSYTMSGNVANADFATQTVTYEGDIATRPNGNGAVDVLDLVSLGRIIANLDAQPATGGEWQRADVAPRANLGDGYLDVLDLVQLGLYSSGLNSLTPAGGAINAAAPPVSTLVRGNESPQTSDSSGLLFGNILDGKAKNQFSDIFGLAAAMPPGTATVLAGSVNATSTNAVVPIYLNSSGDTQAVQFTVNYDSAKLSIPDLSAIQSRYQNTTFIFNNQTPGKLGVVAYQPLDGASVFTNGEVRLFEINFSVVNNPRGTASIGFGDIPTARRGSSPQATAISILDSPGTVTFLAPTAAAVSVSGRVLTPTGRGLTNATVEMTEQDGGVRSARTSAFGYFRFDEVPAGQTCVLNVTSKRYAFAPQVVTVNEDLSGLIFAAQEEPSKIK